MRYATNTMTFSAQDPSLKLLSNLYNHKLACFNRLCAFGGRSVEGGTGNPMKSISVQSLEELPPPCSLNNTPFELQ